MRTSPTPADRSSATFTSLSAISVSSLRERSPATATVSTGAWSLSVLEMIGVRMSRGRLRRTAAILSRTSCAATSIWRLRLKVMRMSELPGLVIERSSLMPWMVLTASSIFWETWVSMSSVEAPGSSVRTETVGRSTAGKRSTPRRK